MTREEIEKAAQKAADDWLGEDARGTLGYAGLVIAVRQCAIQQVNAALEEAVIAAQPYGGTGVPRAIRALKIKEPA
jgi:hypothetical protein